MEEKEAIKAFAALAQEHRLKVFRLLVRHATDDRLHQAARQGLFPESTHLLAGLVDAGAVASCWSGAGPSLLGICTAEAAPRVRAAGERLLAEAGVAGRALVLRSDREGLTLGDAPPPA